MAKRKPTEKQPLKRVVIKEELVFLTGHHVAALILNQFLYWTQRTKDYDAMIDEEETRKAAIEPTHGWVYKSSEELSCELMLDYGVNTMRKYLKQCVDKQWLFERHNPKHAYDRTLQYRANICKIQADLQRMGFALDDYPLLSNSELEYSQNETASSQNENGVSDNETGSVKKRRAIPETTTEISSEINQRWATLLSDASLQLPAGTAKEYQHVGVVRFCEGIMTIGVANSMMAERFNKRLSIVFNRTAAQIFPEPFTVQAEALS